MKSATDDTKRTWLWEKVHQTHREMLPLCCDVPIKTVYREMVGCRWDMADKREEWQRIPSDAKNLLFLDFGHRCNVRQWHLKNILAVATCILVNKGRMICRRRFSAVLGRYRKVNGAKVNMGPKSSQTINSLFARGLPFLCQNF